MKNKTNQKFKTESEREFRKGIEHLWHNNISEGADDEITFNEQDFEKIIEWNNFELDRFMEEKVEEIEKLNFYHWNEETQNLIKQKIISLLRGKK